jgi:ribosomal protein L31
MKTNFKTVNKTWIQLTDGSVISTKYLFEKRYNKLDIDVKAHKSWRFYLKSSLELSFTDKRIINFKKRFNKNNNK